MQGFVPVPTKPIGPIGIGEGGCKGHVDFRRGCYYHSFEGGCRMQHSIVSHKFALHCFLGILLYENPPSIESTIEQGLSYVTCNLQPATCCTILIFALICL